MAVQVDQHLDKRRERIGSEVSQTKTGIEAFRLEPCGGIARRGGVGGICAVEWL